MDHTIPVTVMNEHRDAYWHWHWFIEQGAIPHDGNYLLHIDHHDDLEAGGYRGDLRVPPRGAAEAGRLTDDCLGIADFIIPAVWHGLFSTVHILKNLLPQPIKDEEEYVCFSSLGGDSYIVKGKVYPFLHAGRKKEANSNYRFYMLRRGGLTQSDEIQTDRPVLDVDLDYFSWDDSQSTAGHKRIELTEEAWREYHADRDHPFRLLPKKLVFPAEENGRYYLEYREFCPRPKSVAPERIEQRMDTLFAWLDTAGIRPAAIDVCRSCRSGYMPADDVAFTEEAFFRRLAERWPIERYEQEKGRFVPLPF